MYFQKCERKPVRKNGHSAHCCIQVPRTAREAPPNIISISAAIHVAANNVHATVATVFFKKRRPVKLLDLQGVTVMCYSFGPRSCSERMPRVALPLCKPRQ